MPLHRLCEAGSGCYASGGDYEGEKVPPIGEPMDIGDLLDFDRSVPEDGAPMTSDGGTMTETRVFPKIKVVDARSPLKTVGHGEPKVDAVKLVQGKPAFAADFERRTCW